VSVTGRLLRMARKPSSEIQTDAVVVQVLSVFVGVAGAATLALSGASPAIYLSFGAVALAVAVVATFVALRKLRYERHYGDFFMASVAIASDELVDSDGVVLARKGVDEICELHVIGDILRMSVLNRQGAEGRLTIVGETLAGLRSMLDDMGDELYRDVVVVTARSDQVVLLFKMGFDEIAEPHRYDLANRLHKRVLMAALGLLTGRDRSTPPEEYRMAVLPRDSFTGPGLRIALDGQIARIASDLARVRERADAVATSEQAVVRSSHA
jgi:hypothetical protein